MPAEPWLVGSSDYGLVACFDMKGRWSWRDGLVSHVGSLAVSGDGRLLVLACYSEGLQRYAHTGQRLEKLPLAGPCRAAAVSFDGRRVLVAWLNQQVLLLDAQGRNLVSYPLDHAVVALALGALGERAIVALDNGTILALDTAAPA